MPTSRRQQRLSDIVYYADLIAGHIGDDTYSNFEASLKTTQAVERCLQCITEAAVKLGGDDVQDIFGLEMRDLKDLGNVLRHDYDRVSPQEICNFGSQSAPHASTRGRG